MYKIVLFILFLPMMVGCSRNWISNSRFPNDSDFESSQLDINRGYDCEESGMYDKVIRMRICHESIPIEQLENCTLRVSWREYMVYEKFDDGSFQFNVKFCNSSQTAFSLSFNLLDEDKEWIYVWGNKCTVNLWEIDSYDILLKSDGSYTLR